MNRIIDVSQARIPSVKVPIDNSDSNLIGPNIPIGNTIFGVTGTYSNIKSKQNGNLSLATNSATVTISAVDLTKAIVRITYAITGLQSSTVSLILVTAVLSNSTTITFNVGGSGTSNTFYVAWEVIEFNGVKSLQSGTFSPTASPQSLTVGSVVVAKSMLFFTHSIGSSSTTSTEAINSLELTSSTTLTAQRSAGNSNTHSYVWYLVEFN